MDCIDDLIKRLFNLHLYEDKKTVIENGRPTPHLPYLPHFIVSKMFCIDLLKSHVSWNCKRWHFEVIKKHNSLLIKVFIAKNGSGFLKHENIVDSYRKPSDSQLLNNLGFGAKTPHEKYARYNEKDWNPYNSIDSDNQLSDERLYQEMLDGMSAQDSIRHNRIKRKARPKKKNRGKKKTSRRNDSDDDDRKKKKKDHSIFDDTKSGDIVYVDVPKDLYQSHLRSGVIFRIHMSEAIIKMQYRDYANDKDESVIDADVEYLRLTRKVISDEINKFEDLRWLVGWFHNRSLLVEEHVCNTRYHSVGIPPTLYTRKDEFMKRNCLFDGLYLDNIPYVVGDDTSLIAAVAPPVLHCDAATCTSVPFLDHLMFEEKLPASNVRLITRCQASCRQHCKNYADCLKKCNDECLRD